MRIAVDANILVSALDPTDRFHAECRRVFDRMIRGEFQAVCPVVALLETVCVIRRRTGNEERSLFAYQKLASVSCITWAELSSRRVELAARLGLETGMRGVDAMLLQIACELGIPVVTKDADIRLRAPVSILVFDPGELR